MRAFHGDLLRLFLATAVCALASTFAPVAKATAAPDSFLLGTSAKTNDTCKAVADDEDPVAQRKGGYAWSVQCRGWTHEVGRLYAFTNGGMDEVKAGGGWSTALSQRAACQSGTPTPVPGLQQTFKRSCKTSSGSAYVAYQGLAENKLRPSVTATAEGLEQFSDLLEVGLRTVAGRTDKIVAVPEAAPVENLDAGGATTEQIRNASYRENQRGDYARAEEGFRKVARDEKAEPSRRADADLNWALNESDEHRFKEADDRFQDADKMLAVLKDPSLDALALNFRALHQKNEGNFKEAISLATRAIELRASVAKRGQSTDSGSDQIQISPGLSSALNHGVEQTSLQGLTDEQVRAVRDAQAWYVIASAQSSLGQDDKARASLARAEAIFESLKGLPESDLVFASTGWLHAEILAEKPRLGLATANDPGGVAAAKAALASLRMQPGMRGSPRDASFILNLALAEALDGQTKEAIRDYKDGFTLLHDLRGSLGDSADAAEVYFDLLIRQAQTDNAHAAEYQALYFEAMQSVVDPTTADTMKQLFARISTGDSDAAIIARAFEETKVQLELANGKITALQDSGRYVGADKAAADAEAAGLRAQLTKLEEQLAAKNPHYKALVRTTANIPELQAALKPGEYYVKFLVLSDRGYGLAVTRDQVVTYPIQLSDAEAIDTVKRLRIPFDSGSVLPYNVGLAHDLYVKLFGPVAKSVAGTTHLIYEPDGRLVGLPAGILVTDQASADAFRQRYDRKSKNLYENVAWLGRHTNVSLEVGAEAFIQSRQSAPSQGSKTFIGFGDPRNEDVAADPRLFKRVVSAELADPEQCQQERLDMVSHLKRLPGADDAIHLIAGRVHAPDDDVVLGKMFTEDAVVTRKDLSQFRIVFFGTHGLLPAVGHCLPGPALVTTLGAGDSDGLLGLNEISKLDLSSADLVVLSACNTGGENTVAGVAGSGAALDGLARAFISVGARNLIVSHWEIPADSNLSIMTKVFTSDPRDQAEALGRAQRALMDVSDTSHPYYWGAFTLVGDGAKAFPTAQTSEPAKGMTETHAGTAGT